MENFKGTQGLWETRGHFRVVAEPSQPEDSTFKIGICDVDKGSFISMPFEEKEANAKLIAAAPIMFNALKKLIEVYEDKGQLLAFNVSIAKEAIEAALGEEQQWKR